MRLMIYEPSHARLAGSIPDGVEPVLMGEDGTLRLDGREVSLEEADPVCAWANADVFFGPAARAYSGAVLKAPNMRWVQSGAAGYDNVLFSRIVEKGVTLTTSHGQSVGMSEYVLWGVLDHFQNAHRRRQAQAERRWDRLNFREVNGSHWLVVGFGAIGQNVAERARAFGANITGVRRNPAPHPAADAMAAQADLPRLLPDADVVVLSLPLTPESRYLANAAFFAAMKPGSVLVNVGRGGLVDEPALFEALARGAPEHAVLDVFETEPLPEDSPFWDHPQVTVSAHSSGATTGQSVRNDALFLDNLARFARGEPLRNVADPKDVLAG